MKVKTPRKLIKTENICFKLSPRWKKHIKNKCKNGEMTELIMSAIEDKIGQPPLTQKQKEARAKIADSIPGT